MATTSPALSDSRLANLGARAIRDAYLDYDDRFRIITRRARIRFEERDWAGMAADARERLDLYTRASTGVAETVRSLLGGRYDDKMVWAGMKAVYSGLIQDRLDWELAETFFNSVSRRIFSTVGVDPRIEFVATDFDAPPIEGTAPVYRTYPRQASTVELVRAIVDDAGLAVRFRHLEEDCRAAAARIEEHLRSIGALKVVDRAEVVDAVFYRGKGAYLLGRLYSGSHVVPLVIALLHPPDGVVLDAVLLTENQVSILFSFTRSYFHVDLDRPYHLVRFLRSLMPRKRLAELYISVGHNKHGKTALYRELLEHLASSGEQFEIARGTQGLVMVVFTLPGFDMVFKVIKDTFPANKQVTRHDVVARYRLVFRHDRAGRLVDAQEFEHLSFDANRFRPDLAELLTTECGRTVTVDGDTLHIRHAYVERRVIPLDIYLREADPEAAREAILDYGQAIKDLAVSGIFPGDMLLKNFGVTRHGRVVFYDYDELSRLDDLVFRRIPPARSVEEEMAAEPWFSVGPRDVFPEELASFLGVQGELRQAFLDQHGDLFQAEAWQDWQRRVRDGEYLEIFPYDESARLSSGRDRGPVGV